MVDQAMSVMLVFHTVKGISAAARPQAGGKLLRSVLLGWHLGQHYTIGGTRDSAGTRNDRAEGVL